MFPKYEFIDRISHLLSAYASFEVHIYSQYLTFTEKNAIFHFEKEL
jgi:hypothetical protein